MAMYDHDPQIVPWLHGLSGGDVLLEKLRVLKSKRDHGPLPMSYFETFSYVFGLLL